MRWTTRHSPTTTSRRTAIFADPSQTNAPTVSKRRKSPKLPKQAKETVKKTDVSSPFNQQLSARALALDALTTNRRSKRSASVRLESHPQWPSLSQRDAGFARLLVTTVERRQGQVNALIERFSSKKQQEEVAKPGDASDDSMQRPRGKHAVKNLNDKERYIHAALSLGLVQLLWLQVPPHAAVSETVDLVKHSRKAAHATKYVNAILRKVSRELNETIQVAEDCLAANVAPWLYKDWTAHWGEEATMKIIQAAMRESNKCLTIKRHPGLTQEESIENVAKQFPGSIILPQGSLRIPTTSTGSNSTNSAATDEDASTSSYRGPISSWPGYAEGSWWIQNPSATLPAKVLYSGLSEAANKGSNRKFRVIDLCAAPGGKTAQLVNFNSNEDDSNDIHLQVTAVEVSRPRCQRLQENQDRLKISYEVVVADATTWTPSTQRRECADDSGNINSVVAETDLVHGILLDAPCTATGTGSQRPDVLRAGQEYEKDVDKNDEAFYGNLLETQFKMTCNAVDNILSVGGLLVYATCSLQHREGEGQMERLLSRPLDQGLAQMETVPLQPHEVPGFELAITEQGWVRVLPGMIMGNDLEGCSDGFFVARLRRTQ
ncbi:hypothetical protein MPSEU_000407500 [Mayamaea pseudoterrestris]|nr:hypothetical protein MPSEU_000407500 [Mayamaea pseudoterrestris]